MPAGVVVVKRARRRSFALLWSAFAWVRSVAGGLRWGPATVPAIAPGEKNVLLFPALAPFEGQGPEIDALRACLEACPDDCLSMITEEGRVARLGFDPGRCTGCGRTVDRWGRGLFVATPAPPVFATVRGRVPEIDLLEGARS